MVKLNRIYTKTGDAGDTGLGDGRRVAKDDPRVEAYGEVDEANAALGVCVLECERAVTGSRAEGGALAKLLRSIQHDLFDLGADLCVPSIEAEVPGTKLRVLEPQVTRLEAAIDRYNEHLAPLTSFVLPGGSALACALHMARTITRRAERRVTTLRSVEPAATSVITLKYLNRLSDLLFVLARYVNHAGAGEVLWVPGANRGED
ncbi:cob(I)yrinic acid a,c-diamide adenosyltransferase [soil metagenome]